MSSNPIDTAHNVSTTATTAGLSDGGSAPATAVTDMADLVRRNLEAYQQAARGAFSPATERALRSDSALFAAWCSGRMLSALPAEAATVAAFIDDQALIKKAATSARSRTCTGPPTCRTRASAAWSSWP